MGKEAFKDKIRSLRKGSSDSDSTLSFVKKPSSKSKETPDVALEPYNGDQCFGSCCRGKGYAR